MIKYIIVFFLLRACALAADAPTWIPLFNGFDLTGWTPTNEKVPIWSVKDRVILGQSDAGKVGSVLNTVKHYADFHLELEARWPAGVDSGVFFRTPALQMQIGTSISRKVDLTGSFYTGTYPESGKALKMLEVLKAGEWNRFRIVMKGDTCTVAMNGTEISCYTDTKYAQPGPIGLQVHANLDMKVEFRNIKVVELAP